MRCIYDIKFGMLQVRKNEISLRKCSGGFAQLCALEGTLVTRESARFDKNDTEPKLKLGYFPRRKLNFFKTNIDESVLFPSRFSGTAKLCKNLKLTNYCALITVM